MASEERKVDAFLKTRRSMESLGRGLRALHDGVWLGLLDPAELNQVTRTNYSSQSSIFLDEDYNLSGPFPWEQSILDRFFAACKSVLVAAAGGGREVVALARRGVRADGFECNPDLLAKARELIERDRLSANIFPAAADEVPASVGVYDGAIVGFRAYSHLFGRAARVDFLRELGRHVGPSGPILVSFYLRGPSRRDRIASGVANTLRLLRRAEARVEVGDTVYDRFEHWFTAAEIESEIAAAGLCLMHFDPTSTSHAVARRPGEPVTV